jgi:hypothetical protein
MKEPKTLVLHVAETGVGKPAEGSSISIRFVADSVPLLDTPFCALIVLAECEPTVEAKPPQGPGTGSWDGSGI